MAQPAVAAGQQVAPAAPGQPQQQRQGGFGQSLSGIIRMAVMWYFAMKFFSPKKSPTSEPAVQISNLFQKGEPLALGPQVCSTEAFVWDTGGVLLLHQAGSVVGGFLSTVNAGHPIGMMLTCTTQLVVSQSSPETGMYRHALHTCKRRSCQGINGIP